MSAPFPDVAIVGCGLAGRKRALAVAALGGRVVAVHDAERARAEALARDLRDPPVVTDTPDAAVERDDVALAVIATPHDGLVDLAIRAVSAGSHVLVEKPGGRSAGELELLAHEAARARRTVRVGYNHRFHPAVLAARELVTAAEYGRPMSLRARYGHGGRPGYEREWRADAARSGGGELLDQGAHLIDLARFLLGDVSLAFAELTTSFWPMDVEDNAFVCLRGPHGSVAWLHASWTEWKNHFGVELALPTARADLDGLGGSYGTERLVLHEMLPEMGPPRTTVREWPEPDGSWQRELADVARALEGEPAIGSGVDDALAVLRIVDEAYGR